MSRLTYQEKRKQINNAKKSYRHFQNLLMAYNCEPEFVDWCKKQMNKCVDELRALGVYDCVYV